MFFNKGEKMNRCMCDNNTREDRCLPNCHNNCMCVKRLEETRLCIPSYCHEEERGEKCFEGYIRICPKQNKQFNCACNNRPNYNDLNGGWRNI